MPRLIVIAGCPGSGKSTLAGYLHLVLKAPWIDFGRLREFHLNRDWSNQSPEEEAMTFENLISIIRNYFRHGYADVIVDDLQDHRIQQISSIFTDVEIAILTLILHDPTELVRRIAQRNVGWRNAQGAIAWNQRVIERPAVDHEYKIDVTTSTESQVVDHALVILRSPKNP
jgi:predicted kinase